MNNLFGPGYAANPLGQARESRDALLNMFAPKAPPINPDDPDSIRKHADWLASQGKNEEAIRYTQMAHQVKARQEEGRADNIYATLGQVEGTAEEAQVRKALQDAGRAKDLAKYDADRQQEEMLDIKYDDARMGVLSKKAMGQFRMAKTPEAKRAILEQAIEGGYSQHIEAFVEKEQEAKWKEQDRQWAQQQRQEQQKQKAVTSMTLHSDPARRAAQLKKADEQGLGDLLRQRYISYNDFRKEMAKDVAPDQIGVHIFSAEDSVLKDSKIPHEEYELRATMFGREQANREVFEAAAKNRSSKEVVKAPKTPSAEAMKLGIEVIKDAARAKEFWDFGVANEYADEDLEAMGADYAYLVANGTMPSEAVRQVLGMDAAPKVDVEDAAEVKLEEYLEANPEKREQAMRLMANGRTAQQLLDAI